MAKEWGLAWGEAEGGREVEEKEVSVNTVVGVFIQLCPIPIGAFAQYS